MVSLNLYPPLHQLSVFGENFRLTRYAAMLCLAASSVLLSVPANAADAIAEKPLEQDEVTPFVDGGKLLFDSRLRYEHADIDGDTSEAADALTLRVRYGFETGIYENLQFLVEGDITRDLGVDDFNDAGVSGRLGFDLISDPDSARLNRAHVNYFGIPDTKLFVGRQRIILDNARFIGNVGFRQNEQTFDAVRLQNTSVENLKIDYTFAWQVNRIFGSEAPDTIAPNAGDADTASHFVNLNYALPFGTAVAYAYFVDADDFAPVESNQTFGGSLNLKHQFDSGLDLDLYGEFAHQSEFSDNPADLDLNYFAVSATATYDNLSLTAAFESLEGDGLNGFATPFATVHKFQGEADVFIATPDDGIQDLNFQLAYKIPDVPVLGDARAFVRYHHFTTENGNIDIGDELNLGVSFKPTKNMTASVLYTEFFADEDAPLAGTLPPAGGGDDDVSRVFLTLGFKL